MPRFSLFCARDGDVLTAEAELQERPDAEYWARTLLAARFRLDITSYPTFADMAVETDECVLAEIVPDPVACAAIELLGKLSRHVAFVTGADRRDLATLSCAASADALAEALAEAGHNSVWPNWTRQSNIASSH